MLHISLRMYNSRLDWHLVYFVTEKWMLTPLHRQMHVCMACVLLRTKMFGRQEVNPTPAVLCSAP